MNVTTAAVPSGLAAKGTATAAETASLPVPTLGGALIDPELSQLRFYARVLEEAADPATPLLERVKFLAILGTNLDEFVSVRGPSIRVDPAKRLIVDAVIGRLVRQAGATWRRRIEPALAARGISFTKLGELDPVSRAAVLSHVEERVVPALTVSIVDGSAAPIVPGHGLHFVAELRGAGGAQPLGVVCVPNSCSPLLPVHAGEPPAPGLAHQGRRYVWLDDVVEACAWRLFPGYEVLSVHRFRLIRQADAPDSRDASTDPLCVAMALPEGRRHQHPIELLATDASMTVPLRLRLAAVLGVPPGCVARVPGLHNPRRYWEVSRIARPDLHYRPRPLRPVDDIADVFATVAARDVLLHHPHEAFTPVVQFIRQASVDPDVSLLAMTLYRLDRESPIAHALLEALKRGKRVQVVVELRARHDEAHNAAWARALEEAGAQVVFGAPGVKVHAKLALVERHEGSGLRRYAHIGTGNYHAYNAQFYTDLSLLTADGAVTSEVGALFAALAGAGDGLTCETLLMAPSTLRSSLLARIDREVARRREGDDGHIIIKTNALTDRQVIQALYRASAAGVRVDLVVRGMCGLRPGVAGLSDRIAVRSIVGRLLEHSRVWYFRNGGVEEAYIGSADLRPVNLDRRVEIMVPLRDPSLLTRVRDEVLAPCLADNVLARVLNADGSYTRVRPTRYEPVRCCQEWIPSACRSGGRP